MIPSKIPTIYFSPTAGISLGFDKSRLELLMDKSLELCG